VSAVAGRWCSIANGKTAMKVIDYGMRAPGRLRPEDYPLTDDAVASDIFEGVKTEASDRTVTANYVETLAQVPRAPAPARRSGRLPVL
jgi:hypothetical protein